jgi:hypothetical protein
VVDNGVVSEMAQRFEVLRDCNVASRDYTAGEILQPEGEVNVTTCVMFCKIGVLRELADDEGPQPPVPEPEPPGGEDGGEDGGEGEGGGEDGGGGEAVQPVSTADAPHRSRSRK